MCHPIASAVGHVELMHRRVANIFMHKEVWLVSGSVDGRN